MPSFKDKLNARIQIFLTEDRAATAIEYGLITAAMCTVVVAAMGPLAESGLWDVFTQISDRLNELTNP